jgi:hypothetical protein
VTKLIVSLVKISEAIKSVHKYVTARATVMVLVIAREFQMTIVSHVSPALVQRALHVKVNSVFQLEIALSARISFATMHITVKQEPESQVLP